MKQKPRAAQLKSQRPFDAKAFLESTGPARKVVKYRRGEVAFRQDDSANDVRYVQKGAIKVSVISRIGKEAVVAILTPGDFFGEGFMNKFRKLGFIEYNGGLKVNSSLLTIVLHD